MSANVTGAPSNVPLGAWSATFASPRRTLFFYVIAFALSPVFCTENREFGRART
jgi:hypothetical protein